MLIEGVPALDAGSRIEISQQRRPIIVIRVPKYSNQALALAAVRSLLESHLKKDGVPPTDFVVAIVANQSRIVAERENLLASYPVHSISDLGIPHIPPRRASGRPNMEHRRKPYVVIGAGSQGLKIAPSANSGETPGFEPFQGGVGPKIGIDIMLARRISRVARIEVLARSALVDTTDAQGKEAFAGGPHQPGCLFLLLNRKGGREQGIFTGRGLAESEPQCEDCKATYGNARPIALAVIAT